MEFQPCLGALCNVVSFHPQQIKFCAMHSVNLGYVLWAAGSGLDLLISKGVWGSNDVAYETKLKRSWNDFLHWAKQRKIQ